jgi:hypothetical protein
MCYMSNSQDQGEQFAILNEATVLTRVASAMNIDHAAGNADSHVVTATAGRKH